MMNGKTNARIYKPAHLRSGMFIPNNLSAQLLHKNKQIRASLNETMAPFFYRIFLGALLFAFAYNTRPVKADFWEDVDNCKLVLDDLPADLTPDFCQDWTYGSEAATLAPYRRHARDLRKRTSWCVDKPCRLVQYDDNTIVEACKRYLGWTSSL
jgi:hypothetical protein